MLTPHDEQLLTAMQLLYMDYLNGGDDSAATKCADLLVKSDDPQALWEAHIEWSETVTGVPCPDGCRDITQTVRIKNRNRLN